MSFIRSISGLRATLGDDLTPRIVADYACAAASVLPEGAIAVGRDGRPSGEWIESIVVASLQACGRAVVRLGVVPTPTVQLYAERPEMAGGIAITASHNPAPWNGLKFINERGVFMDAEENRRLWESVDASSAPLVHSQRGGAVVEGEDALATHIAAVLALPFLHTDHPCRQAIAARRPKAVVDAVNSSGSAFAPALLRALGCEVVELYCDGSGDFPHTPEPLPENLGDLARAVAEHRADIGIAVDPDADRLVIIDEQGNPIGEESTVVIAAEVMLRYASLFPAYTPAAVVNLSTTMAVEHLARRHGAAAYRSPVGEINVVNEMQRTNALVGGEGSGGVIVPAVHSGRDSLVGIALAMAFLAESGTALSQAVSTLPRPSMVKTKFPFSGSIHSFVESARTLFADGWDIDLRDGLRAASATEWVQLRSSNTEPIVRVIAEAPTRERATELVALASSLFQQRQ